MRKYTLSVILVVALLTGCEKNDVRTPALTIIVHGEIIYWKYSDYWAFLTDESGNVLDAQQLVNNSSTQLKADANTTKLNLTIFNVFQDGLNNYYLRTFTDLPRGGEHHIYEFGTSEAPPTVGTVKIRIDNFKEPVETIYGGIYISPLDGFTTLSNANPAASTYLGEISLYSSPQDILLSSYRNGLPVYHLLKGATANSDLQLNFDDFKPAETIFQPPVPVTADIGAVVNESGRSFRVASDLEHNISNSDKPFSIGYPAGFEKYFIRLRGSGNNGLAMQLEKRGAPVTSLQFPTFSYSLKNSDIGNFDLEISSNATHKQGYWIGKNTGWRVFSPGNQRSVMRTIPEVIRKKYPDIDKVSDMSLFTLAVYQYVGGDYHSWLDLKFGDDPQINFEEYSGEKQVR